MSSCVQLGTRVPLREAAGGACLVCRVAAAASRFRSGALILIEGQRIDILAQSSRYLHEEGQGAHGSVVTVISKGEARITFKERNGLLSFSLIDS